jgi:NRPS condensation-like uncharacterized protein
MSDGALEEKMSHFMRKIGAERTLLMVPINIVVTGRVEGAVTPKQVQDALDRLRARHLQLAVRVRFDDDGTGWYVSDDVPAVPVRIEPRVDDDSWLACAQAEYRKPFPIEKGPLVRCVLVRAEDRLEVLLVAHHVISDGMSLTFLLRDLLQAIAHPEDPVEALPAPPPIDATTVPQPPRTNLLTSWIMNLMNRKWAAKKIRFGETEMQTMHEVFWERNRDVHTAAHVLDETATAALVARCREEKVTVNAALWAAFLSAQDKVQRDDKPYRRRSALAVSTRDKLNVPVGEVLGFFASSLSVNLPDTSREPFWDSARAVHEAIKQELARTDLFRMLMADGVHPTLLDALYFQKLGMLNESLARKLLRKMSWHKVSYGYALTNVGRLDIPTEYGALKLNAVFGPSFYSDVDEKVVGAITVGGKLTLTLNCSEEVVGQGAAKALLETTVSILAEASPC